MKKDKKTPVKEEKFKTCSICGKACIPGAIIKPKNDKERVYCNACLTERIKGG